MSTTNRDKFHLILIGLMQGTLEALVIFSAYITLLGTTIYFFVIKNEYLMDVTLAALFALMCTMTSSLIFNLTSNMFLKKIFNIEHCWNSKIKKRARLIPQLVALVILITSISRVLIY